REGRVPLHTLRADIDYGTAEAKTQYGIIGIKVWVYKGEIFDVAQIGQEPKAVVIVNRVVTVMAKAVASARRSKESCHVATQANQIPQAVQGPQRRSGAVRQPRELRRIRPEGDHPRRAHRAPDRGRSSLHHPLREARRQAVDPRVPGQADHQEADRSAYG